MPRRPRSSRLPSAQIAMSHMPHGIRASGPGAAAEAWREGRRVRPRTVASGGAGGAADARSAVSRAGAAAVTARAGVGVAIAANGDGAGAARGTDGVTGAGRGSDVAVANAGTSGTCHVGRIQESGATASAPARPQAQTAWRRAADRPRSAAFVSAAARRTADDRARTSQSSITTSSAWRGRSGPTTDPARRSTNASTRRRGARQPLPRSNHRRTCARGAARADRLALSRAMTGTYTYRGPSCSCRTCPFVSRMRSRARTAE